MRQFVVIGSLAFLPGVMYVLWLVRRKGKDARDWLKHEVTIGLVWLSAFPASVGLLSCTLRPELFSLTQLTSGAMRSGDLAYTRVIRDGLLLQLEKDLTDKGVRLQKADETGPSEPDSPAVQQKWADAVKALQDRGPFDYYIGIGTQASMALSDNLGILLRTQPMVFLGVTDPVNSGLVDALQGRNEDRKIAGIAYVSGLETILAKIHDIFPDRKLVFVYNTGYRQDVSMAERIKETGLYRRNMVEVAYQVRMRACCIKGS